MLCFVSGFVNQNLCGYCVYFFADIHVDAGNSAYRGPERYNTDPPLTKNKPEPILQKAIKAIAEKTSVSSAPRVNTVPAGVTSVASLEPAQSKYFHLFF